MENKRIGKKLYSLWLSESEERVLNESLNKGINSVAWTIIKKAFERGDFKKS